MNHKKWKKFSELSGRCYFDMIGAESDYSCWIRAYEMLKELVQEEKKMNPAFEADLAKIDEDTDYEYDIMGWLEDCLDEVDLDEDYELLLQMCNELLTLFTWQEYSDTYIRSLKASTLCHLERLEEASAFCRDWLQSEPDNYDAAAAYIRSLIFSGEIEAAKEVTEKYLPADGICTEENEELFEAALKLYETAGEKEKSEQINKAIDAYNKELEALFGDEDDEDWGDDDWDDDDWDDDDWDDDEDWDDGPFKDDYDDDNGSAPWLKSSETEKMKPVIRFERKIYPNDPCPCGSGKKYKQCCGKMK